METTTTPPEDARAALVAMTGIYVLRQFLLDNKRHLLKITSNLLSSLHSRKESKKYGVYTK